MWPTTHESVTKARAGRWVGPYLTKISLRNDYSGRIRLRFVGATSPIAGQTVLAPNRENYYMLGFDSNS